MLSRMLLMLWALLVGGLAQTASSSAPAPAEYVIGPGDVLMVQVFGEKDLSGSYRVGASGNINLPPVGGVAVAGLTVEGARQRVSQALASLLRRPQVTITIDELASVRKVYVGGQVDKPGPYELPFGASVLDAVLGAGVTPAADLRRVHLLRPGQPPQVLDLSGWRTAQGVDLKLPVRYGDMIFVPELTERIAVLGAVERPATLVPVIGERLTLLQALGAAGGLAADADPAATLIIRPDAQPIRADLRKLFEEGDLRHNPELQPGDVVVVPKVKHISVVGQVATPVSFTSSEPVPVLSALARAGQLLPDADLAHAKIITAQGTQEVNLQALMEKGAGASELKLNPGEVLVIPEAAPEEILLAGAVRTAGPFNVRKLRQRDLLRVITSVGLLPGADATRICVLRGDQQLVVNYDAILKESQLSHNLDLQPGDVVYVPSLDKVYVLGAVGQGGMAVPCPDSGLKLLDALIAAGGLAPQADPEEIHLIRPRPEGTAEHVHVRLGQVRKGQPPPALVVKPGDVVYVAARGRPFHWQDLAQWLWTLSSLRSLLRW
jgi:polysaccharide export outer membrane protein